MLLTFDAAAVARLCPYDRLVDALALGLREPIVSPARMHLDIHRIAHLEARELEKGGVENNALRISDLGDGLDHV